MQGLQLDPLDPLCALKKVVRKTEQSLAFLRIKVYGNASDYPNHHTPRDLETERDVKKAQSR